MKRILVPTDFSPTAEKAFRFALDLAQRAKGTIILCHAYTPVESPFVDTEKARKQYNDQNEAIIRKKLHRLKKRVTGGNCVDVAVSVIVGHLRLVDNILGFAEHHQIDMIIMGTQGASGLKKTLIGSVAARVIQKSHLPILLVPAKYELDAPRQFVFATNYQPADQEALVTIEALAKLYNADIIVLHLFSAHTAETEKVTERNDFNTHAFSLKRAFSESSMQFHLLEAPSFTEKMETLDKKFPYAIIAMVKRKKKFPERLFIKSFTKKTAYVTRKPFLVIPEKE